jgi:hypothetical protein
MTIHAKPLVVVGGIWICVAGLSATVWAGDPVGEIAGLRGTAMVVHQGQTAPESLSLGASVFQQDMIRTGAESKVKVRFNDETVSVLGAKGTLKITEFVYDPEQEERSSVLTVSAGILRTVVNLFVPDSKFEVHSATAVASMRATEWVAETFPGTTHLVVMRGAVAVTSTDPTIAGSVILEAGEGTKVDAGAAPAAKGRWGQNRVRSFEEQTALD